MISIRKSRSILLPLLLLLLIFFAFNSHLQRLPPSFPAFTTSRSANAVPSSPSPPGVISFWDLTSRALVEERPGCSLPTEPIEAPLIEFANLKEGSDTRPDLLEIPQQDVDTMRDAHARFVSRIPELAQKLPYARGTKGIAVAASGAFLPVFMVSLKMLRRTGSILPVEVFMESRKQYEKELCEDVLPPLNATCMILSEVMEAVPERLEMSRYQLKALALAFSSFEDVLLLDADNIALEQPEHLLNSEPFLSTGFVSWPDYYANTASPSYYTISSQPIPLLTSRAASEAGQLLLSKSKHAPTVLLTLYYNAHGPTHYYRLLTQNPAAPSNTSQARYSEAATETDKETYLAAAMALINNSDKDDNNNSSSSNDMSIYTVTTPPHTLGYTQSHDKAFIATGMIQHNPSHHDDIHSTNPQSPEEEDDKKTQTTRKPPPFLHAHIFKPDAAKLPDTFNYVTVSQRIWGPKEQTADALFGGRDVEKQVWAEALYTGCHLQRGVFGGAWGNATAVCTKVGRVYKFLFN